MDFYLPQLVVHADWSISPGKRWLAVASRRADGRYEAAAACLAPLPQDLLSWLRADAGPEAAVLVGFDFPIGLPLAYARQVEDPDFLTLLPRLSAGEWAPFFQVAATPDEIGLQRPFYPQRPGGASQQHLVERLGVETFDELRRRCEWGRHGQRRAASPLFWTLGGQQVGKAAISGWRDVLQPALRRDPPVVSLWPFAGDLKALLRPGSVVVAETYPAEFYRQLDIAFTPSRVGGKSGKRVQADRLKNAGGLLDRAEALDVMLAPNLRAQLATGFGTSPAGEDPFDAVVGLLGMLKLLHDRRTDYEPEDEAIRRVEGWILGQVWS